MFCFSVKICGNKSAHERKELRDERVQSCSQYLSAWKAMSSLTTIATVLNKRVEFFYNTTFLVNSTLNYFCRLRHKTQMMVTLIKTGDVSHTPCNLYRHNLVYLLDVNYADLTLNTMHQSSQALFTYKIIYTPTSTYKQIYIYIRVRKISLLIICYLT